MTLRSLKIWAKLKSMFFVYTHKKCVAGTKKHIAVPAILLATPTIIMSDIT